MPTENNQPGTVADADFGYGFIPIYMADGKPHPFPALSAKVVYPGTGPEIEVSAAGVPDPELGAKLAMLEAKDWAPGEGNVRAMCAAQVVMMSRGVAPEDALVLTYGLDLGVPVDPANYQSLAGMFDALTGPVLDAIGRIRLATFDNSGPLPLKLSAN